jgi:hypothetical protein
MLLAEELALVALDPGTGRHAVGVGGPLNACLAGLLLGELVVEGVAEPRGRSDAVELTGRGVPASPTLAAAAQVLAARGPRIKPVLSHMHRGLTQQLGMGTWDAALAGLADAGVLSAPTGGLRPRRDLLGPGAREAVVTRLQAAGAGDGPTDARTALVLSMTGPAHLLQVVAPDRHGRRHARARIDHALDGSILQPLGKIVRRLVQEAAAGAAAGAA